MSIQSFRKKYLTLTPGKDTHRYNVHAWIDIDSMALRLNQEDRKDEEGIKEDIRFRLRTLEHRVQKLIASDLTELDKEKK